MDHERTNILKHIQIFDIEIRMKTNLMQIWLIIFTKNIDKLKMFIKVEIGCFLVKGLRFPTSINKGISQSRDTNWQIFHSLFIS